MKTQNETALIDGSLEISQSDIEQLWDSGTPTDDALSIEHTEGYIRSKRSEDGKWHLKYDPLDFRTDRNKLGLTVDRLCSIHDSELERLKHLGIHIITYGRVALNEARLIMTIAPWIDNIEEVEVDYALEVEPLIKSYYIGWIAEQVCNPNKRPYYATDLTNQFSKITRVDSPFLHDVDPYLDNDANWVDRHYST